MIKEKLEDLLKISIVYSPLVAGTFASAYFADKFMGNPYYHFMGVLSANIAHTLDDLSSQPVINNLNEGMKGKIRDNSPLLNDNLSVRNYMLSKSVSVPLVSLMGFVSPFTGMGYLASVPYIVYNNLKINKALKEHNEKND